MKIFLTGASGFIGSRLLKRLVGHEILCVSRFQILRVPPNGVQWIIGDLGEPESLAFELKRFNPEVAIHLAWQGLPDYSKQTCELNVNYSLSLLSLLRQSGVKRIVVAGSCFEYGDFQGQLCETSRVEPSGDYPIAKLRILRGFQTVCDEEQIELVWARIFYSFGPGQRNIALLPFVYHALVNGERPVIRNPGAGHDFIFIDDVATALVSLVTTNSLRGVFNIGSGHLVSVAHFVNLIANQCGSKFRVELTDDVRGFWASVEKIVTSTTWRPFYTLNEGIEQTIREIARSNS